MSDGDGADYLRTCIKFEDMCHCHKSCHVINIIEVRS